MKKYLLLSCALLLVGCTGEGDVPEIDYSKKTIKVSKEGGFCGGAKKVKCSTGLECSFNPEYPAVGGKCVDSVVDHTMVCPTSQAPVCGLKNRQKNGYLNECEAERHGAKVLGKGLCKKDEAVVGSCEGEVRGVGNCDTIHTGYEFKDGDCEKMATMGCEVEVPFASAGECVKECEK